jgi:hypothetical protein
MLRKPRRGRNRFAVEWSIVASSQLSRETRQRWAEAGTASRFESLLEIFLTDRLVSSTIKQNNALSSTAETDSEISILAKQRVVSELHNAFGRLVGMLNWQCPTRAKWSSTTP